MSHQTAEQERITLFHQGSTISAYDFMGSHPVTQEGQTGYVFRVWAPTAKAVSVVGDFNSWDQASRGFGRYLSPDFSNMIITSIPLPAQMAGFA